MAEVFGYLVSLEPIYFEDVVVVVPVNSEHDDACKVAFLTEGISKINCGDHVKSFSFIKPLVISLRYIVRIVILKKIPINRGARSIMRIVVVLSPEMQLIKVLSTLDGQNVTVETEPLSIDVLRPRPDEFTCAIADV